MMMRSEERRVDVHSMKSARLVWMSRFNGAMNLRLLVEVSSLPLSANVDPYATPVYPNNTSNAERVNAIHTYTSLYRHTPTLHHHPSAH
jgi:hypothetical protein